MFKNIYLGLRFGLANAINNYLSLKNRVSHLTCLLIEFVIPNIGHIFLYTRNFQLKKVICSQKADVKCSGIQK